MTDDTIIFVATCSICFVACLGFGFLVACALEKLRPGCTRRFFQKFFGNDAGLFKK